MYQKIKDFIITHKLGAIVILCGAIVLIIVGAFTYNSNAQSASQNNEVPDIQTASVRQGF